MILKLFLLFILVLLISNLKWLIIVIVFPFQVVHQYKIKTSKDGILLRWFNSPYSLIERVLRGGYIRWMMFSVGLLPSLHLRRWIYRKLGAEIRPNAIFHFRTEIRSPHRLVVGGGTIIGDNALLDARNGLYIGKNVNLSSNVSIYTEQHDHRDPYFACTERCKQPVVIGDKAWVGSNVVILPGVTIGEGAVCCAGCVVTKDVNPYEVVAGIPAKKINERPRNLKYSFSGRTCRLY